MRQIMMLLWLLSSSAVAYADVYKCYLSDKQVIYQPMPCAGTVKQNKIAIDELTPQQIEEAKQRLAATHAERQALDEAEQKRKAALAVQQQTETLQREVEAAKREAEAARLDAATARQQATTPYRVVLPYPVYDYGWNAGHHHHNQQQPMNNSSPFLAPRIEPFFLPQPMIPPSSPRWNQ